MNLSINTESSKNNIHGNANRNDVIAAIRRAYEGKFLSVTEAALAIKGRICATQPVLADREDVESVSRVLLGEWDVPLSEEEQAARDYYLAANKEEQAIIRLLLQVAIRDENLANETRGTRLKGESHPELVAPALNKAIAEVHWLLSKRVA